MELSLFLHQPQPTLLPRPLSSIPLTAAGICFCDVAGAAITSRRALRGAKIPDSEYTTLPNGLKYYDLKVGNGAEAVKGSRVAVHYVAKWKNITFMTSRQGLGVGGGTPYGFDVGQSERGNVLKGLDLGVEGMRVGGQEQEDESLQMQQLSWMSNYWPSNKAHLGLLLKLLKDNKF